MTVDRNLLERLKDRGEEVLTQVSGELMSNPRFMKAMEGALRGKEKLEDAASRAIRTMNIPTRTEFKKALSRIDALEREVAALKGKRGSPARSSGRSRARPATPKTTGKAR
jgi:polyhydroxyalkanoate synthesis regulator phasin